MKGAGSVKLLALFKFVTNPVYLINYEFLCRAADTNALLD